MLCACVIIIFQSTTAQLIQEPFADTSVSRVRYIIALYALPTPGCSRAVSAWFQH